MADKDDPAPVGPTGSFAARASVRLSLPRPTNTATFRIARSVRASLRWDLQVDPADNVRRGDAKDTGGKDGPDGAVPLSKKAKGSRGGTGRKSPRPPKSPRGAKSPRGDKRRAEAAEPAPGDVSPLERVTVVAVDGEVLLEDVAAERGGEARALLEETLDAAPRGDPFAAEPFAPPQDGGDGDVAADVSAAKGGKRGSSGKADGRKAGGKGQGKKGSSSGKGSGKKSGGGRGDAGGGGVAETESLSNAAAAQWTAGLVPPATYGAYLSDAREKEAAALDAAAVAPRRPRTNSDGDAASEPESGDEAGRPGSSSRKKKGGGPGKDSSKDSAAKKKKGARGAGKKGPGGDAGGGGDDDNDADSEALDPGVEEYLEQRESFAIATDRARAAAISRDDRGRYAFVEIWGIVDVVEPPSPEEEAELAEAAAAAAAGNAGGKKGGSAGKKGSKKDGGAAAGGKKGKASAGKGSKRSGGADADGDGAPGETLLLRARIDMVNALWGRTDFRHLFTAEEVAAAGLATAEAHIALDAPVMSPSLERDAMPVRVTIKRATSMPPTPVSFEELTRRCAAPRARYSFAGVERFTRSMPHGPTLPFADTGIFLAGLIGVSSVREFFQDGSFVVEVRDRDAGPRGEGSGGPGAGPGAGSGIADDTEGGGGGDGAGGDAPKKAGRKQSGGATLEAKKGKDGKDSKDGKDGRNGKKGKKGKGADQPSEAELRAEEARAAREALEEARAARAAQVPAPVDWSSSSSGDGVFGDSGVTRVPDPFARASFDLAPLGSSATALSLTAPLVPVRPTAAPGKYVGPNVMRPGDYLASGSEVAIKVECKVRLYNLANHARDREIAALEAEADSIHGAVRAEAARRAEEERAAELAAAAAAAAEAEAAASGHGAAAARGKKGSAGAKGKKGKAGADGAGKKGRKPAGGKDKSSGKSGVPRLRGLDGDAGDAGEDEDPEGVAARRRVRLVEIEQRLAELRATSTARGAAEALAEARAAAAKFVTAIFVFPHRRTSALEKLVEHVIACNVAALGLESVKKLAVHILSDAEAEDPASHLITGFHLIDGVSCFVMIEGPQASIGAACAVASRSACAADDALRLFNPIHGSGSRRWHTLRGAADLPRYRVNATIADLAKRVEVHTRSKVSEDCGACIDKLSAVRTCNVMADAIARAVIPTAVELEALERRYAGTLTEEDELVPGARERALAREKREKERRPGWAARRVPDPRKDAAGAKAKPAGQAKVPGARDDADSPREGGARRDRDREASAAADAPDAPGVDAPGAEDDGSQQGIVRTWDAGLGVDVVTTETLRRAASRVDPRDDPMLRNRETVRQLSENTRRLRAERGPHEFFVASDSDEDSLDGGDEVPAFNYSTQRFNSTERAREKLRRRIERDKGALYTYSDKYASLSFDPTPSREDRERAEELERRSKFTDPAGFVYPVPRSKAEDLAPAKRPTAAEIEELRHPWVDPARRDVRAARKVEAARRRMHGKHKFDAVPTRPGLFSDPGMIGASGDLTAEERLERSKRAKDEWRDKVVVRDTRFHVTPGSRKTNQIDMRKGILQDPPKKRALRKVKVEPAPFSMFIDEDYEESSKQALSLRSEDTERFLGPRTMRIDARDAQDNGPESRPLRTAPLAPEEKVGPKWGVLPPVIQRGGTGARQQQQQQQHQQQQQF